MKRRTLSSKQLLQWVGLERRKSAGRTVATGLGFAALGAAVGAGAVLARALFLGREKQVELEAYPHEHLDEAVM